VAGGENTFEQCRLRYQATQERLAREGRGRVTASRVADEDRYWAPTRDCLQELMRWGAVEQQQLPSERKFVAGYRDVAYALTDRGRDLAAAAQDSRARFTDLVTDSVVAAHPYVRQLLWILVDGPIAYPYVGEGDIQRGRASGRTVSDWAAWAAERIAGEPTGEAVETELKRALDRFRRRAGDEKPTNKELAEAMTDGFAVAGFRARGLQVDATTIRALLRWGSELLLFDQSRYVPAHPQAVVIWGCCDLEDDGGTRATRRGQQAHGDVVARAILEAYAAQSATAETKMAAPFLPVHRVRAEAALAAGVTRALVDRVLVDLVDDAGPSGANVAVFVGSTTSLPQSEPPFRYRGSRRLVMQVTSSQQPSTARSSE
jgi:hypothetical protein